MTDTHNWITTRLKLERRKVRFSYEEDSNQLTILGFHRFRYQLLLIYLPFGLALVLIIMALSPLTILLNAEAYWLFSTLMIFIGSFGINTVERMNRSNTGTKIIKKGRVTISNGTEHVELTDQTISHFHVTHSGNSRAGYHAELLVSAKDEKQYVLLGLQDESRNTLLVDLDYIAAFLEILVFDNQ